MFRVIKGELIKKRRGGRSLREVAAAVGVSNVALLGWEKYDRRDTEKKGYKPSDDKIPALLAALGCSYEDITEPVDLALN